MKARACARGDIIRVLTTGQRYAFDRLDTALCGLGSARFVAARSLAYGRVAESADLDAAYFTFHKSYVESVWWALSTLFDKGLLYQGHKIVWWWAQGGRRARALTLTLVPILTLRCVAVTVSSLQSHPHTSAECM